MLLQGLGHTQVTYKRGFTKQVSTAPRIVGQVHLNRASGPVSPLEPLDPHHSCGVLPQRTHVLHSDMVGVGDHQVLSDLLTTVGELRVAEVWAE